MNKRNKIINIVLIFTLIFAVILVERGYSADNTLRIPMGKELTFERIKQICGPLSRLKEDDEIEAKKIKSNIAQWGQIEKGIQDFLFSNNLTARSLSEEEIIERLQDYMEGHGYGRVELQRNNTNLQPAVDSMHRLINSDRLGKTVVGKISIPSLFKVHQYIGRRATDFLIDRALEEIQDLLKRYGGIGYIDQGGGVINFAFRSGLSKENNQHLLNLIYTTLLNRFRESYACATVQGIKTDSVSIDSIQRAIAGAASDYIGVVEQLPEGGWRVIFNGRGRSVSDLNKRLEEILSVAENQLRQYDPDIKLKGKLDLFENSAFLPLDAVDIHTCELGHVLSKKYGKAQSIDVNDVLNMVERPYSDIDFRDTLMNVELLPAVVQQDPDKSMAQNTTFRYRPNIRFKGDQMPSHSSLIWLVSADEKARDEFFDLPGGYMILLHDDNLYVLPSFTALYRELPRYRYSADSEVLEDVQYMNFIPSEANLAYLIKLANIRPEKEVLELFSGTGWLGCSAALHAKEVLSLDVATGINYLPERNRKMLDSALLLFPKTARPHAANTTFLQQDITDQKGVSEKLRDKKFPIIIGDPPFGWGFRLQNGKEEFQIFLESIPTIKAYLESDGIAVFLVTRNWLRREELAIVLKKHGLKIAAVNDSLDSKAMAIVSIVNSKEKDGIANLFSIRLRTDL